MIMKSFQNDISFVIYMVFYPVKESSWTKSEPAWKVMLTYIIVYEGSYENDSENYHLLIKKRNLKNIIQNIV